MNINLIRKKLQKYKKKTITLKEIAVIIDEKQNCELFQKISILENENIICRIKASNTDGNIKFPLFNRYRIVADKPYNNVVFEEIRRLNPVFCIEKYLKYPQKYNIHKCVLEPISDYLWQNNCIPKLKISRNERSFEIFLYEKFIEKNLSLLEQVFKFNKLELNFLNFFDTYEPFFEYVCGKNKDMKILVIENKDTWFSLKKAIQNKGENLIFGLYIDVLIYGEGNKITRKNALDYYRLYILENNIADKVDFLYFGDLDFEGVDIFMRILSNNSECLVYPFMRLYELMIKLSYNINLPKCFSLRKKNIDIDVFLDYFNFEIQNNIKFILNSKLYIPQEIVNYEVFMKFLGENCDC
ncbi:MAG: DUF2220 family protein [Candidatus Muirbacterium halophilum]|nr:DUF2220 family protein [Candidatus Muirbacterium halophilum]MCK9474380.1 DUF2220 family protein [Candidatus Muirbacterium halophilum]